MVALASGSLLGCTGAIDGQRQDEKEPDQANGGEPTRPGRPSQPGTGSQPGSPPASPPEAPAVADLRMIKAGALDEGGSLSLRGLTRAEYNNTIAALLGDSSAPALRWGAEIKGSGGFLEPRPVSSKEIHEYMDAAAAVVERARGSLSKLMSCDPAQTGEDACAAAFVKAFGRRAFRRPLLPEEEADYVGLWTTIRKTHGLSSEDATALVTEAMLQSPSFMYHWQLGPRAPHREGNGSAVRLTGHELAARLSYFLTQSPPDEALSAAADSGAILDPAELKAHATRLMASSKAKELLQDFVAQILDVSEYALSEDATHKALDRGRRAFVERVLWEGKATPSQLLLDPEFHVNETVAGIYGVTGVKGDAMVAKTIDAAKRFGVLTHADFLIKTSAGNESLAPKRGKEIWERVLCGELPSAVPPLPPDIMRDTADTMREHFEKKIEPLPCARACHQIVDNAGFAFENYAGPVWRDQDAGNGKTINARGVLTLPFGGSLAYDGPRQFVEGLARSEEVRQCFVRQMFRLANGRTESGADAGSLRKAYDAFQGAGEDLKALAVAVVGTKAFSHRRLNEGEIAR